jgi:hypothetical protein
VSGAVIHSVMDLYMTIVLYLESDVLRGREVQVFPF